MKVLSSVRKPEYRVGLTGKFVPDGEYYAAVILLNRKLIQIIKYCEKHGREVVVFIDQNVPAFFYGFLYTLGVKIRIIQDEPVMPSSPNIEVADIFEYITENCDVTVIIKRKDDDLDTDNEKIILIYNEKKVKDIRLRIDPREPVKKFVRSLPKNNDPYAVFYHEDLFERVPYNHWEEVMDQMPDIRDPFDREFL